MRRRSSNREAGAALGVCALVGIVVFLAASRLGAPQGMRLTAVDEPGIAFDREADPALDVRRGRGGQHFVRARVDGEEVGWFLFDTGSALSFLDDGVAARLGLVEIGGPVGPARVRVGSIELGPLSLTAVPMGSIDVEALDLGLDHDLAGILGMDVIQHAAVEFDPRDSRIFLYPPDRDVAARAEVHQL